MLFADHLVVVRGGGDLGTGVADRLVRAGFPVIVLELAAPLAVRRRVSFSSAVTNGGVEIEGTRAVVVASPADAVATAQTGDVAVLVAPDLPDITPAPSVVVDARLAKRNLDTTMDQASLVIALGPGFTAGEDCHAVIETMRGHRLGRVIWSGNAEPDTGMPGILGGVDAGRVIRATAAGTVAWGVEIGDLVAAGQEIGTACHVAVHTSIAGVVRGLIAPGTETHSGLKIADIDPRGDRSAPFEISDKARLVGAGVLEAVLAWLNER
jgi:xanthine dehydrogenase accessory factor